MSQKSRKCFKWWQIHDSWYCHCYWHSAITVALYINGWFVSTNTCKMSTAYMNKWPNRVQKYKIWQTKQGRLIDDFDWLLFYGLFQEYFTHISPLALPLRGCNAQTYVRRLRPLRRDGFLSCHTWIYLGPWFTRSRQKDRPILLFLKTSQSYLGADLTGISTGQTK